MKPAPVKKISRFLIVLPWAGFWVLTLPTSPWRGNLHLPQALAQPILSAPDGTNTVVTVNGNQFDISGGQLSKDGANLFHSLQRFGLSDSQIANFLATPNLNNILTRITGGEASVINGLIRVSGGSPNLYLINPAGVMFGQNARLDVPGSFLVTTATGVGFGEQWFQAFGTNDYSNLIGTPTAFVFDSSQPGTVVNAGELAVGMGQSLTLLGGTVINTGTLSAPGGTLNVMGVPGNSLVRISQPGHLLSLEINQQAWEAATTETAESSVTPEVPGQLPATTLPDLLTGETGIIPASHLTVNELGQVVLAGSQTPLPTTPGTAIAAGTLTVAAPTPGEINILGQQVIVAGATVDASGDTGGGVVRIGGDWQGQGTVSNAIRTVVDQNTTITANALETGKAGRVVVWADENTSFRGNIQARGHTDGGMVEVSGKQNLWFDGSVDTQSSNGSLGTLLLDPINITIVAAERSADDADILTDNQVFQRDAWGGSFTLSEGALESLSSTTKIILEASNNITIEALSDQQLLFPSHTSSVTFKADADGDGSGTFSVNPVNRIVTQGGDLTIVAADINLGDVITEGGNISVRSTHDGAISTGLLITDHSSQAGDISLTSNRMITTTGISAQGEQGGRANLNAYGDIYIGGIKTSGEVQSGDIFVISGTGNIDTRPFSAATGFDSSSDTGQAGGIQLDAGQEININRANAIGLEQGGDIRLIAENRIAADEIRTSTGTLHLTSNEIDFTGTQNSISGNQTLVIEPFSDHTTISLSSNGIGSALNLTGLDMAALQDGFSSITIGRDDSKSNILVSGTFSWQDPLTLLSGSALEVKGTLAGLDNASLTLLAPGTISVDSLTTQGQPIKLISEQGDIRVAQGIQTNAESATIAGDVLLKASEGSVRTGDIVAVGLTGGRVQVVAGESLTVGAITASGIDQGGKITLNAGQTLTSGGLDVSASFGAGGRITLSGGEMQLASLNAQGATVGGQVEIDAGQSVRLTQRFTDRNQVEASISAAGGQRNGSVILNHQNDCTGSGCQSTFTVGDASVNGSVGAITNGSQILSTPTLVSSSINLIATNSSVANPTDPPVGVVPSVPSNPTDGTNTPDTGTIIPDNGVPPLDTDLENDPTPPIDTSDPLVNSPTGEETGPLVVENPLTSETPVAEGTEPERSNSDVDLTETGSDPASPETNVDSQTDSVLETTQLQEDSSNLSSDQTFVGTIQLADTLDHSAPEISRRPVADRNNVIETAGQIDQYRGQQFSNYFGDSLQESHVTNSNIRETFSRINHLTDVKPAIIYVSVQPNQLELRLFLPDGKSFFKSIPIKRADMLAVAQEFSRQIRTPVRTNNHSYRASAQQLYQWMIQPLVKELTTAEINTLIFSMDAGLRSLPLAAIYDGEKFLIENYSIALIPSLSLTDTRYVDIKDAQVLAMGASEFPDDPSQSPLPAVPLELSNIVGKLWPGLSFLNQDFTLANLKAQRKEPNFKIIHLATHGEFHPGGADQSYIQLWDTKLKLNQLRELKLSEPQVELLVLSACTTAVGDEDAELGFAGLAVQAGVKSALASLWYISDAGTLGLMTEFYQNLRQGKIKAEALRQAQLALLQGKIQLKDGDLYWQERNTKMSLPHVVNRQANRDLSHPYYWAAFTMIGSPW